MQSAPGVPKPAENLCYCYFCIRNIKSSRLCLWYHSQMKHYLIINESSHLFIFINLSVPRRLLKIPTYTSQQLIVLTKACISFAETLHFWTIHAIVVYQRKRNYVIWKCWSQLQWEQNFLFPELPKRRASIPTSVSFLIWNHYVSTISTYYLYKYWLITTFLHH